MKITEFPGYIFWSYAPDADLPQELVAEQVILYGDLEDLFRLSFLLPKEILGKVNNSIEAHGKWLKRVNFIKRVILED